MEQTVEDSKLRMKFVFAFEILQTEAILKKVFTPGLFTKIVHLMREDIHESGKRV